MESDFGDNRRIDGFLGGEKERRTGSCGGKEGMGKEEEGGERCGGEVVVEGDWG